MKAGLRRRTGIRWLAMRPDEPAMMRFVKGMLDCVWSEVLCWSDEMVLDVDWWGFITFWLRSMEDYEHYFDL